LKEIAFVATHPATLREPAVSSQSSANRSLTEIAYAQLKQWIVDCDLAPGQWLTERQLSEQLQMGLSPVRGALARLDHEGLVSTSPRRGYRVTTLTLKTVHDLFTAWNVIGPAMARMAAEQMTADQLKALTPLIGKLQRPHSSSLNDVKKRLDTARKFFKIIAAAAGNPILEDAFDRLDSDMRRSYIYVQSLDLDVQNALGRNAIDSDWETVFRARDGEKAAQLVSDFVRLSHDLLTATLSSSAAVMSTPLVLPTAAG
jgi:DNA-binding GntR family transcriptional regulator